MKRFFFSALHALRRRPIASSSALLLLAGVVVCCQSCASSSRKNYPTTPYRTVAAEGRLSIREYPALKIARTSGAEDGGSFMRLFRYIGGANEKGEKISMTTPVLMEKRTMSFVLPQSHQKEAPRAGDTAVEITTLPARQMAVCSYSGRPEGAGRAQALEQLRAWLQARKLAWVEEPVYAVYDGPFTLPAQRLNEVMLPLKP
ncbi:SOUL family heme-binding protein [Prosthecobacter sp.]|uniref:SOUL family heme-binding protein n=1 Tax=Prosthecobacter sp. TaxID=1965333 RepID=UPI003784C8F5